MLEPSRDRLDYGAMLRPPEPGFSLVHAVASTYSLELSALLAALLPLGVDGDAKSHCRENPLFMLYIFKKLFRKIFVFCDAAAVSAQDVQRNKLLAFLDRIVFPVRHRTSTALRCRPCSGTYAQALLFSRKCGNTETIIIAADIFSIAP